MTEASELVAYSSQPAFVLDGRKNILAFNAAAEQLLGRSQAEATSFKCDDLLQAVRPDGGAVCGPDCEGAMCLALCQPYSVSRCFVVRKDGSRVAVAVNSMAIPGDPRNLDRPVGIVFISTTEAGASTTEENDTRLRIKTLGRFQIVLRGCCLSLEQWPRKQAVQLLKYLVVHAGRPVHRERLIELLWPDADEPTAWSRLKVTVHFLRQKVREAGFHQEVISTTDSSYLLRQDCVWIDAVAFEDAVGEGRVHQRQDEHAEAAHAFEDARRLYRGDFMEADLYADWCAEDRERYRELYVETLISLAEIHYAKGSFAAAAQECHNVLVQEPCREDAHRLLLKSFIGLQRPESAIHQFRRCESILEAELGVAPSAETAAVVAPLLGIALAATR